MHHHLKSKASIDTYFNYPSKHGVELHRDSLIYLYGSRYYSRLQQETIIGNFPLVEREFFTFPDLGHYDLVVYSPLVDYLQNTYSFREDPNLVISWGDFTNPTGYIHDEKEFLEFMGLTESQIMEISSKWLPIGPITPKEFIDKLDAAFDGDSGRLILMGGAAKYVPMGQQKYVEQHLRLNESLRTFQKSRAKTSFIDVDDFLTGIGDFTVYKTLPENCVLTNRAEHRGEILRIGTTKPY